MKRGYLLILVFALISCTSSPKVSQPSSDERATLDSLGSYAAKQLVSNLQQALLKAVSDGGPANGIAVCRDTAQALTRSISAQLGDNILIKRTSSRIRNPKNRPDEYEEAALKYFRDVLTQSDSLPPNYAQKIQHGSTVYYRYYKPMQVAGLCLNCHGDPKSISPEVQTVLNEKYPHDAATGYQEDDFRGVISVTINREF
ncbi:MAG: hypothetical protein MAGBODY4_00103 [Candidatus Marinimicrobia bacterium]|nr:hypothetical protein [Candidatus Neomarinimicrobiota bacterium]